MSVKWEKQDGNQGVLTITVDAKAVNEGLDKAFQKVVKQVNVPGFRKGKMPRPLFEKRFGVESLYQDALDFILPEAYANAIDEAGIEPVDRPEIDVEQMEKGKELVVKATVTVKPEVALGEYKGLEATKLETEVTEEDVTAELTALQERKAELVLKEEGAAANGDTVVIDFEGFVDGEAFEGGQADNYSLELGSNSFIPGFEEQLVGLETGAEKDVEVSFPEEYHAAELAGKAATFKVKLHEIKAKQLPELNDEFAKEAEEEVSTLAELKEKIQSRLEETKKADADQTLRDSLVEQAVANATVDIPAAMIESEIDRMVQEFGQRLQMQGMTLELYFQFSGQDEAALRGQMREDAEARVRTNLTLEAIAKAENLTISDEEVEKEVTRMSEQFNLSADQIKAALGGDFEQIKIDLRIRQAVELLVDNAK